MGLLKVKQNKQRKNSAWQRQSYGVSQTDFLGRRRFVRVADPVYRESWQSDIAVLDVWSDRSYTLF